MNIADNYDLWEAHERRQQRLLDRLPKCDHCRKPIQDEHYFDIYGVHYCYGCMVALFRMEVILDE